MPISEIAERAGTTVACVQARLSPTRNRRNNREHYRSLQGTGRKAYINAQIHRRHGDQDETTPTAEKFGNPWTEEELNYLRDWGGIKKAKEIAIDLKRTFYAVERVAQKHKIPLRK